MPLGLDKGPPIGVGLWVLGELREKVVKSYCGEVEVSLGLFGGDLGGDEIGGRRCGCRRGRRRF